MQRRGNALSNQVSWKDGETSGKKLFSLVSPRGKGGSCGVYCSLALAYLPWPGIWGRRHKRLRNRRRDRSAQCCPGSSFGMLPRAGGHGIPYSHAARPYLPFPPVPYGGFCEGTRHRNSAGHRGSWRGRAGEAAGFPHPPVSTPGARRAQVPSRAPRGFPLPLNSALLSLLSVPGACSPPSR